MIATCVECGKPIDNDWEGFYTHCDHAIGEYTIIYFPAQGTFAAKTHIYNGMSIHPILKLPGIDRRMTQEVIEKLLLLK
jgi:hypothetical protein